MSTRLQSLYLRHVSVNRCGFLSINRGQTDDNKDCLVYAKLNMHVSKIKSCTKKTQELNNDFKSDALLSCEFYHL